MKKKPNIKELFGPTLDDDVAMNNTITVQAKFKLCPEQDLILNKIMEHLTQAKIMYFNYLVYSTKMNKFMKEHALYITKEVKVKDKITIVNKTLLKMPPLYKYRLYKIRKCLTFLNL